jgi:hypothetical protein
VVGAGARSRMYVPRQRVLRLRRDEPRSVDASGGVDPAYGLTTEEKDAFNEAATQGGSRPGQLATPGSRADKLKCQNDEPPWAACEKLGHAGCLHDGRAGSGARCGGLRSGRQSWRETFCPAPSSRRTCRPNLIALSTTFRVLGWRSFLSVMSPPPFQTRSWS